MIEEIELRVEGHGSSQKLDRKHGGIKDVYSAVMRSNPERAPQYVLKIISSEKLDIADFRLREGFRFKLEPTNRTLKEFEPAGVDEQTFAEMSAEEQAAYLETHPDVYPFRERTKEKQKKLSK